MHDMTYYIHRQGSAMLQALGSRRETCASFVRMWAEHRPDRLYLVGSGTSGNAVRASAGFMEKTLGVETTAVSPTSLPKTIKGRPMFIYVSQGGKSTNTLKAIETMRAYPGIALTGEADCAINTACGSFVKLDCEHEDAGPKTMGYTGTILTLYMMALEAALHTQIISDAAYGEHIALLTQMAEAMDENVAATEAWYALNEDKLKKAALYLIVGIDEGCAVAQEAALKIQETTLRGAIGFEYEEYLHGPIAMLYEAPVGIYLHPAVETQDSRRMDQLMEIHRGFGDRVYAVRCAQHSVVTADSLVLRAPEREWLAPFWQILPSQVIGARLPGAIGTEGKLHELFVAVDKAVSIKHKG